MKASLAVLALAAAPTVSGFGVVVPPTKQGSSNTALQVRRKEYAKPPIDVSGLAQAAGFLGAAGACAGLAVVVSSTELPSMPGLPSVSVPSSVASSSNKPAKKSESAPASRIAPPSSAERFAAKRAALEAKQQQELATKKVVAKRATASKADTSSADPASYEDLFQKASSTSLVKTSESITVEKKAKAAAEKVESVGDMEGALKSELKSVL